MGTPPFCLACGQLCFALTGFVVGVCFIVAGLGLLKRGRGGKMTQHGCYTLLVGLAITLVSLWAGAGWFWPSPGPMPPEPPAAEAK
jgi:hypothetical protein